jgi:hypothetical protein
MTPKDYPQVHNLDSERRKRIIDFLKELSPTAVLCSVQEFNKVFSNIFVRYLIIGTPEKGLEIIGSPKLAFERDSDMLLFFMEQRKLDRVHVFGGGIYSPSHRRFEELSTEFGPAPTKKLKKVLKKEVDDQYELKGETFNDNKKRSRPRSYSIDQVKILVGTVE